MTEPQDGERERWVDGSLESGADDATSAPGAAGGEAAADPEGEKGVGLTMGEPTTFEPEEDPS